MMRHSAIMPLPIDLEDSLDKQYQLTPEERELGPRSHQEWLQEGKADVVYELYATDCVIHSRYVQPEMARGVGGFKDYAVYLRSASVIRSTVYQTHSLALGGQDHSFQTERGLVRAAGKT